MDDVVLTLHEHLGDPRGGPEIAVDLERRMGVPEVVQGGALELLGEHLVGVVAVQQPCPEVDLPRLGPAGAAVAARGQRDLGRLGLRRARFDLVGGVQGVQVGDVPVGVGPCVPVALPLLELAPGADAQAGVELGQGRAHLGAEARVHVQLLGRGQGVAEHLADDLLRHRRAGGEVAVLGGVAGRGDQLAVTRIGVQEVEPELRRAFDHRVRGVAQVAGVAGEAVAVVQVLGGPGGGLGEPEGGGPVVHAGEPERVGLVVDHPAAGAVHVLRGLAAGGDHGGDVAVVRLGRLVQVGLLGEPVVHLQVDVDVVVGSPGRTGGVVPDALEVGRQQVVLAGGGDEQVAAVGEEQLLQRPVVAGGAAGVVLAQPVGGDGGRRAAEVQFHPVEQLAVVGGVRPAQLVVAPGRGGVHGRGDLGVRVRAPVGRVVAGVVGAGRQHEDGAVGAGDGDRVPRVGTGAALRDHLHLRLEPHLVVAELPADGEPPAGRGDRLVVARRAVPQRERHLAAPVGRQPADDHIARVAGEVFTRVADPARGVADPGHGLAQAQLAPVGGGVGGRVGEIQMQVAERLVRPEARLGLAQLGRHVLGAHPAVAVDLALNVGDRAGTRRLPVAEVVAG